MRKIYTYFNGETSPVEEFFLEASPKIKNKFVFQMSFITDDKKPFCEPHIKHFSIEKYKRLYEMRMKFAGTMVRIIFYEYRGEVILLHAFYKKNKRDTEKALECALKILNAICNKDGMVSENYRKELTL